MQSVVANTLLDTSRRDPLSLETDALVDSMKPDPTHGDAAFRLDTAELISYRDYLRHHCGLWFPDAKLEQVATAIQQRCQDLGITDSERYRWLLRSSRDGDEELTRLAACLTVGETYFLRNNDHWRAFEQCVIPWVREYKEASGDRVIRVWSAACSTGEEAYTIALFLHRLIEPTDGWSVEVVGTDINPISIKAARVAEYALHSFRGVPDDVRRQYFEPTSNGALRPIDLIRNMVRFEPVNLCDSTAIRRMQAFDVVFCRNVLIYFDDTSVKNALEHIHRALRRGGYLFLGHSEKPPEMTRGFASLNVCNTFVYKTIPRPDDQRNHHVRSQTTPPTVAQPNDSARTIDTKAVSAERVSDRNEKRVERRSVAESRQANHPDAREKLDTPPDSSAEEPVALEHLFEIAVDHLCHDANEQAGDLFNEILRRDHQHAFALLGLALILAGKGDGQAALSSCQRVLDHNGLVAEAHCIKGVILHGLGHRTAALKHFDKALYLDPSLSLAYFHRACTLAGVGRPRQADRDFQQTLQSIDGDSLLRVQFCSGGFPPDSIKKLCRHRLRVADKADKADERDCADANTNVQHQPRSLRGMERTLS